jgi:hypothetical protein
MRRKGKEGENKSEDCRVPPASFEQCADIASSYLFAVMWLQRRIHEFCVTLYDRQQALSCRSLRPFHEAQVLIVFFLD